MLVFVPVDADRLTALLRDGLPGVACHAATPALRAGLGLGAGEEAAEDAEFGALTYASVASLVEWPSRGVAVADVRRVSDGGDDFGSVTADVAPGDVRSLFIDEPAVRPLVERAHAAVAGRVLADAWEDDTVQEVLAEADLLWHDVEEAPTVLAALRGEED